LDLTKEQYEQVRTILEDNKENAQTAERGVRNAQKALHDAVIDEAGEEAIRNAAAEVGKAIGDQAVLRAQTAASVKGVLTEEQLVKLDTIKEKMQELREDVQALEDEIGPGQYRRGTGYGPKGQRGRGRRGRGMRGHRPGGPPPMQQQW
jgi:Spy/CpxP family protein refolding chaperone